MTRVMQTWFATPLYYARLKSSGLSPFVREIERQCQLVRKTDPDGEAWSRENYLGGFTSYGSMSDLHLRNPYFAELQEAIDPHVRKFARALDMDLQGGELRMVTCWVNIMPERTTHSGHIHPLSVISGTFYVKVPRGSSAIKFEDPRLTQMMAAPPKLEGARPRNQQHVKLEPKAGDVALWESWLRHEVPPNPSREERISISFNYDWI